MPSKCSLPMFFRLRCAYGLWWRNNLPDMPTVKEFLTVALAGLAMALALNFTDVLSTASARVSAANAKTQMNALAMQQLVDCMNGKLSFSHPTEQPRKGSYGKTVTVCRGAEEFAL